MRRSAGEEREVTGVHDEAGVQVETLCGSKTQSESGWVNSWTSLIDFWDTDLGQSWASCWTSRPRVPQCPPGHCWRPSRSERWASRLWRRIWFNRCSSNYLHLKPEARVNSSPAVFCFLMGGAREGLFCIPVATTTCEVGTAIMAGAAGAGAGVMATAAFLTVFFGDSEEMGTRLSSYNFLFTVLFIWALYKRKKKKMRRRRPISKSSTFKILDSDSTAGILLIERLLTNQSYD